MRALLVAAFLFWACPVWAQNTPKLEVGKVYAVVLSCQKQYIPTQDGLGHISDCYIEYWRILSKPSKDGWVTFEDAERKVVWWGNINRALAITEAEPKEAKPEPAKTQA